MNGRSYPPPGVSYPAALAAWSPRADVLAGWWAREPALAGLDFADLPALLLDRATSHARRDALLAALLRLAVDDDDASTGVVVCLLPGLRRLVRRLDCGVVDRAELWAEVMAQTFAHVRGYDLSRRPQRIAANLLMDAMSHTLAWLDREGAWRRSTVAFDTADLPRLPEPDGGDLLDLAVGQRVVSARDAALVRATRLDDFGLRECATAAGMTYDGAKKRRQRAEDALRRWLAE